jgi:CO/xanthine dehydrogenase FAD-binding subunit
MPQLKAYHRPGSVAEALQLLARPGINTAVIGGGAYITPRLSESIDEVVDLQAVGLDDVSYAGQRLTLDAMVHLQTIVEDEQAPVLLRESARREGPNTLRNMATIGGVVASPDADSELLAALLVFEAEVKVQTMSSLKDIPLADFLDDAPAALGGGLVISVSLSTGGKTASDRVGRTPADQPIVAAVARMNEQAKILLALCGVAHTPVLVDPNSVKAAVNPSGDFRGSGEYRRQMAAVLAKRVIDKL